MQVLFVDSRPAGGERLSQGGQSSLSDLQVRQIQDIHRVLGTK